MNASKTENYDLFERKEEFIAYKGMSKPRHLLCVAIQSETYEKSNSVFIENLYFREETED